MKYVIFFICLVVPVGVVGFGLFLLYTHFIAPFGTTGLAFFILGGGLVIPFSLVKAVPPYLEFLGDIANW